MVPRTLSLFPLPSLPTTQRGLQLRRREVWRLTSYDLGAEGNRGIARIFQRGRGGGGRHTVSHRGYGPANGVCNYLAQKRIYCMLILPIPVFSPTELKGRKTIISQHGGGGDGTGTKDPPSYAPGNGGMLVKSDLIFGAWGRCVLHGSLSNSAWFLHRIYFSFALLQFSSILPSFHQTFVCSPL